LWLFRGRVNVSIEDSDSSSSEEITEREMRRVLRQGGAMSDKPFCRQFEKVSTAADPPTPPSTEDTAGTQKKQKRARQATMKRKRSQKTCQMARGD
jgi:CDGSH-type Zn-finger protein